MRLLFLYIFNEMRDADLAEMTKMSNLQKIP